MSVADRLASLTPEQRALFEALRQKQKKAAPAAPPPVARVSGPRGAGDWPLTFDQERLWFLSAMDPETTAFNMVTANRLRGGLDVAALAAAVAAAVHRHGAWRTTFPVVDGGPVQRVAPELPVPLPVVDLSDLPAARREAAALGLADDDARRPFDVAAGPLVRATLARLAPREHVCILTVHHIVSDLVSFQIFWGELAPLYAAAVHRMPSPLPPPPVQFADFAVWQRRWMDGEVLQAELDWWRGQLAGFPLVLDLPTDRPRPLSQAGRGGRHPVLFDAARTEALRALAKREGATRFMVVAALTAALLQPPFRAGAADHRHAQRQPQPSGGGVDLRLLPHPDPAGRGPLGRPHRSASCWGGCAPWPWAPSATSTCRSASWSRPSIRSATRAGSRVVQALVQLLDATGAVAGGARLGDLEVEGIDVYDGNARYDLMLVLFEGPETIAGPLEYDADLFDRTTVARMADLLGVLLDAAAADPGLRLSALPAFAPAARHQVMVEWNDTALPGDAEGVLAVFAAQAARTPGATAWGGRAGPSPTPSSMPAPTSSPATCGAAAWRSRAWWGSTWSARPRCRWPCWECSSPAAPTCRSTSPIPPSGGLSCWRTREPWPCSPRSGSCRRCSETAARPILLDTGWAEIARESAGPLPDVTVPANRAYVIYTSGSTGRPKGVDISRFGLAHLLRAMRALFGLGPGGVMPSPTTIAFDLSVPELYMPMLSGGSTPLLTREVALDGVALARALEDFRSTVFQASPSTIACFSNRAGRGGRSC